MNLFFLKDGECFVTLEETYDGLAYSLDRKNRIACFKSHQDASEKLKDLENDDIWISFCSPTLQIKAKNGELKIVEYTPETKENK